jgi:hypothetical protein
LCILVLVYQVALGISGCQIKKNGGRGGLSLANNRGPHEKHELFVKNSRFICDGGGVRGECSFHFQSRAQHELLKCNALK